MYVILPHTDYPDLLLTLTVPPKLDMNTGTKERRNKLAVERHKLDAYDLQLQFIDF